MAITRSAMQEKVRRRLSDRSTRPDGTSVTTPEHPSADIQTQINDTVRLRQSDILQHDPSFYKTRQTFTGQTDAVVGTSNEQYTLPTSPAFLSWVELRRTDLSNYPLVPLVPYDEQDSRRFTGFFSGFYSANPSALSPATESAALLTTLASNLIVQRFRILPAPASTSYTYALWYMRKPVEPSDDAHNLDIPDDWQDLIAIEAALELAESKNEPLADTLRTQRDRALAACILSIKARDVRRAVFGNVRMSR